MDNPGEQPLAGLRVLELGNYIAAPMAGRLLADFGAEVIKVERPRTGDELRGWRLHGGEDTSLLYRTINRNKLSMEADLRSDRGRHVVSRLVEQSDALIENFRPGTLDAWGLGADRLSTLNPDLVVARISAFGQSGPMSARGGFAAVAEAFGGLRALVGEADRPPARVGVSIGDSVSGLYAAFGIVMCLLQQQRCRADGLPAPTPRQQHVDVALHEAVFSMMESLVPDYDAHRVTRTRSGGRVEGIAPSNSYACGDGTSIVIAGNGDSIFGRLMRAIGRPDLAEDPALATNQQRWEHRDRLDDAIGEWARTHCRAEALGLLEEAGVPAGPIYDAQDILADEQFAARRMLQRIPVETAQGRREIAFPGIVPLLGDTSLAVRHGGPDLGADTVDVLDRVLGMTPAEIDEYLSITRAA